MASTCSYNADGIYGCFAPAPASASASASGAPGRGGRTSDTLELLEPFANYRNELVTNSGNPTRLVAGDTLLSSDGMNILTYQNDGNLVLSRFIWSAGVTGKAAGRVEMQGDGNLVMYDLWNRAYWSTNTDQNNRPYHQRAQGPFSLTVQNDKNIVVYWGSKPNSSGRVLWSSGTNNRSTC
jgi:lipopolysaccharide export system protein LptA